MSKKIIYKVDWTDKEYDKGLKEAIKYINNHGGERNLGYAYTSTDSFPGFKIVDNSPKGTPYTGVIVLELATGKYKFISDESIDNGKAKGNE